ncbi:amidase [Sporolactobacillus vineae]|uniref:amidase n=1 Tax=Sporolactobacillus vineae TaxID=444463 RepID=UPI000287AD5E|nr:amidase [Sporolactobacillus vineae]
MPELTSLHATELIRLYSTHKLSPVDVTTEAFKRIRQLDPSINALITLNEDQALRQAKLSEERYRQGNSLQLDGVPVAIKDLTNTKGIRTTYGSLVYRNYIPGEDATVVRRLKAAGAIIIGKTNTPEFGHKGTTSNRLFGATKNPWNLRNGTGGSSGGSAAAVAAGFCPIAEGSDGGGSIRIPSSLCGIYGFKPTFGRVPSDNHPDNLFGDTVPFISHGPMARTVADAALMFDAIQGPSLRDPYSLDRLVPSVSETLTDRRKPFRVGFTENFGIYPVDAEIGTIFRGALRKMEEGGASVAPAKIKMGKDLHGYVHFFNRLWMIGLAVSMDRLVREHRSELSDTLISMIERGQHATADEYLNMNHYRTYLWKMFQDQLNHFDILVSPTLGAAAYTADAEGPEEVNGRHIDPESEWMMTSPINLTGQPACSVPIGFTRSGLPVGMQCICRRLDDRKLFQFARWVETLLRIRTLAPSAE